MSVASLAPSHAEFEAALPRLTAAVRYGFRNRSRQDREEALAEARAAFWAAWSRLIKRGKDPVEVGVTGITNNVIRYVRSGRRVGNSPRGRGARDIFSERVQAAHRLKVISLNQTAGSKQADEPWKQWTVVDNRCTPADEACFRVDFEGWLESLPGRKRQVAELLAEGHETGVVARMLGVTPGAVSQARTWLAADWQVFQGEALSSRVSGTATS